MIQNQAALNLSKGQLRVNNDDGEFTLPLEDIIALVLESPQITVSSALLSACQDKGVCILTCDATHTPNGILLPFHPHSRQSRIAHLQLSWSIPLKKRLWQAIVQAKIKNQANCLAAIGGKKETRRLEALVQRVQSGDPDNIEAQAARDYWPRLMGNEFRRGEDDIVNAALNYGYAVIRAFVARSQVAHGLLPTFGIHHDSELNAFNLVDDIMEVFRPFVDRDVHAMKMEGMLLAEEKLLSSVRQRLVTIPIGNCILEGQVHTIATACDKMAAGLVSAIERNSAAVLHMPSMAIG